jgi:hypothetical protein
MKVAKTLAILIALVMVIFCFNAPADVRGDEHPWDQEGGDGTLGGDTLHPGSGPLSTLTTGDISGGGWSKFRIILVNASITSWYYDLPAAICTFWGVDGHQENEVTCTSAK